MHHPLQPHVPAGFEQRVPFSTLPSLRCWRDQYDARHQCQPPTRPLLQTHPGGKAKGGARSVVQQSSASAPSLRQSPIEVEATPLAIKACNVSKSFGERRVLEGTSLQVPRGRLHMLLGPNGCGKSTLLRLLGGLLRADGGTCRTSTPASFVFQNPDHQVVMPTVGADVAFGLGRYELPEALVRAQVEAALSRVGLHGFAERQTHTLSGGQKQRVAIAGALAECPKVLLLDELTTFLDGEDQRGVLEAVRACVGGPDQVTALWVTHRLEEISWADSVSYMDEGRIQFTGSPQEATRYLRRLGARVPETGLNL